MPGAEIVDRLAQFLNHDLLPVVFEAGSLGASGDLSAEGRERLAHLQQLFAAARPSRRNQSTAGRAA